MRVIYNLLMDIFKIILIVIMIMFLIGCGSSGDNNSSSNYDLAKNMHSIEYINNSQVYSKEMNTSLDRIDFRIINNGNVELNCSSILYIDNGTIFKKGKRIGIVKPGAWVDGYFMFEMLGGKSQLDIKSACLIV